MKRNLRTKIKITENDIKNQVKAYLDLMGWFNFHILQGMGSYKGIPDRIAVKGGRVLFLEVKKPNGKLSEGQQAFKANIENVGGEYYVIDNLDKLMNIINERGWK